MLIAVGFITYPIKPERVDYLERALKKARAHFDHKLDEAVYFAAIQTRGCDPRDVFRVRHLCNRYYIVPHLDDSEPGMGKNHNLAMRRAFDWFGADYLLLHQDDFYAIEKVNLREAVSFMEANRKIDVLTYHCSPRPEFALKTTERSDGFLDVDPESEWFYDDSPHLRRPDFPYRFGWHLDGTPELSGEIEKETIHSLRMHGARIVKVPGKWFEKDGPVSAS